MIVAILASCTWAEVVTVRSPDGKTVLELTSRPAELVYKLSYDGQLVVEASSLALVAKGSYEVLGVEQAERDSSWKPVWGSYSEVRDHCNELIMKLKVDGLATDLICRVYDDGVGFRFAADANKGWKGKEIDFALGVNMPGDTGVYYTQGEKDPAGPIPLSAIVKAGNNRLMPFVLEANNGAWLALLESDLYTAKLFNKVAPVEAAGSLKLSGSAKGDGQAFVTPWRVLLVGNSPGDLLNSTVALNVAAPCAMEDTSWIQPGKTLWDWRVHGYDNGDFTYDIDTQSYLRFIDFAAEHGIEYFTIDDHWYKGGPGGSFAISPAVDIEKVMNYAKEKGVKIILYFDRRRDKGKLMEDPELFDYYSSLGAAGMKYGFRGSNVRFTRSSIEGTAEKEMFIFYHDSPAAMLGVERTLPNMFSREFCHAQQDSRKAFSPTGFLKMAMINALTGPLDMGNGNFGIKSINSGQRKKGPRKKNSYVSTVVSEVARTLVISSPLVTLPDAPEEYAKKPDLFAVLTQMPTTWDETIVVNSKMAEYITTARRTGDTWFVASVNNETPSSLDVRLDFLKPGVRYEAELFEDTADAHGFKNPEVYQVSKKAVTAGDVITAKMAHGGGHVMLIREQ